MAIPHFHVPHNDTDGRVILLQPDLLVTEGIPFKIILSYQIRVSDSHRPLVIDRILQQNPEF